MLASIANCLNASEFLQKNIMLSADIENEKFFSYSIDTFKFEDPDITVEFDESSRKLENTRSKLVITTNVPSYFQSGYKVSPNKLSSVCVTNDGVKIQEDFADYYIDEDKLVIGESLRFDDFSRDRDSLWVKKPFLIDFSRLNMKLPSASYCKGIAVLVVELDF